MGELSFERREYIRVETDLPVQYKLLSADPQFQYDCVLDGTIVNLSGGGVLLRCTIPQPEWADDLLANRMVMGLSIDLHDDEPSIKALTRVARLERLAEDPCEYIVGLRFKEITRANQDRIFQYVIQVHIP